MLKAKRMDEARAVIEELRPSDPDDLWGMMEVASLYYGEKLYDDAEPIYRELQRKEGELFDCCLAFA